MALKRILTVAVMLGMILIIGSTIAYGVSSAPVVDIDFSKFKVGDEISGFTTQYIPDRGTITYQIPEGYDFTCLCFNDTYTNTSGPKMIYPFEQKSGIVTAHTKFIPGNAFRIDYVSSQSGSSYSKGIRIATTASGSINIEDDGDKAGNFKEITAKVAFGEELEIFVEFDFYGKIANICMTSPTLAEFSGLLPDGVEKVEDYIVIKNVPLSIENVGKVMYLPINGTGKSYLEFIRLYNGNQLPVEIPGGTTDENTYKSYNVQAFKAPWIARPDTVVAYQNGYFTSESQRFGPNRVIPEVISPDITPYLPDLSKLDENMKKVKGVHPRVLFKQADYDSFKKNMEKPEFAPQKERFINEWCVTRMETPVALRTSVSSVEQHYRIIGQELTYTTWAYKLTDEQKYADKALEWMEFAFEANDNNDNKPADYEGGWVGTTNYNLAAGQYVRGLADVYDRCYDLLSDEQKANVISHLLDHGGYLYRVITEPLSWGENQYLGNFGMCQVSGLLTAAVAIYDEEPQTAKKWIEACTEWFANLYAYSGTDGASIEGINYWSFGYRYVLTAALISAQLFDYNPVENVPWIKNSTYWRLYISLPRNSWTKGMNVMMQGDSDTTDAGTMEAYLYAIADVCDLPAIQWLADELQTRINRIVPYVYATWNTEAESKSPEELELPTLMHFDDRDYISARSDWSGDESMVYFGCGSLISKTGQKYIFSNTSPKLGEAHAHPDANHFQLFGNGDFLLRDDGYVWKQTNSHNTLLVNGEGQKLEGNQYIQTNSFEYWYEYPYIKKVVSLDEYDYFVGCGANAYPLTSGLERFNRHMLYLKNDDVLVVIDDIKTLAATDLELRYFPKHETVSELDGVFVAQGPKNTMYMEHLTEDQGTMQIIDAPIYYKQSSTDLRNAKAIAIKNKTNRMTSATAISWSGADATPKRVKFKKSGKNFVFTIGNKVYTVNPENYYCSYKEVSDTVQKPTLSGVVINNIPVSFEEGVYDYSFNLDDHYITAENSLSIKAIPGVSGDVADIKINAPENYPGKAVITATAGGKSTTYNITLTKTDFGLKSLDFSASASGLKDKDLNTFYVPKRKSNEIIFTLTGEKEVAGFGIAWQNSGGRQWDYEIHTSLDGTAYTPAYSGKSSLRATTMEYTAFEKAINAKYIKLVIKGEESDSYFIGVAEFAAYRKN